MKKRKKSHQVILFAYILISCSLFSQNKKIDSAYIYFKLGVQYSNSNNADISYKYYSKAKKIYSENSLPDSVANCNLKLFGLLKAQNDLGYNPISFLNSYYNLYFFGAILYNFFWKYEILGRIYYLFIWFEIFCLAAIAYYLGRSKYKLFLYLLLITQILFFMYKILKGENQCAPFQFIPINN